MVGDVVSRLGVRDQVIIQTKIPFPRVPAGEIKARFLSDFAGCLERLQTTYVDILMIHQPSVEQMNNPHGMTPEATLRHERRTGSAQRQRRLGHLQKGPGPFFQDVAGAGGRRKFEDTGLRSRRGHGAPVRRHPQRRLRAHAAGRSDA